MVFEASIPCSGLMASNKVQRTLTAARRRAVEATHAGTAVKISGWAITLSSMPCWMTQKSNKIRTVEGLSIASEKAYEFIGFLTIMLKKPMSLYGFGTR